MPTKTLIDYLKQEDQENKPHKTTTQHVEFYKETNFKETPIGKIPKEWEVVKLGTLCRFKRGFSYRSNQITNVRTQIRFITINDLEKEGGLKRSAEKIFLKENVEGISEFLIENGDLFIANTDMAKGFIIGAPLLVKDLDGKAVYSMDLTKLIFDKSKICSEFLFYYLAYEPMRKRMKASAQGTNVLHLNHEIVGKFLIPLPPLLEQQKIAEVLFTVDQAIQKTNEVIAKTERLKKGLMQELLTKGIGHKEFKDTEIGRIPKEWEVVKLGTLCRFKRGFSYRSNQITNVRTQIRFITINDLEKEGGLKRSAEKIFLKENVEGISEFLIENGDLFIANTDMAKGFIIGAPLLVKDLDGKAVYSMDLTKLIFDKSKICSEFLFYYLAYEPMRKRMKASAQGTNVLHLNHEIVGKFLIPLPPLLEQQKIAEILSTVDKKLEIERKEKAKLERIKQGLMDLLLTGKVRVRFKPVSSG